MATVEEEDILEVANLLENELPFELLQAFERRSSLRFQAIDLGVPEQLSILDQVPDCLTCFGV